MARMIEDERWTGILRMRAKLLVEERYERDEISYEQATREFSFLDGRFYRVWLK